MTKDFDRELESRLVRYSAIGAFPGDVHARPYS